MRLRMIGNDIYAFGYACIHGVFKGRLVALDGSQKTQVLKSLTKIEKMY